MSFFEASESEPLAPVEPDYRPPEWAQPPDNVMPAAVPLDSVLARGDGVAVWVADALVYTTGLQLTVVWVRRDRLPAHMLHRPLFMQAQDPDGPRFGVGFADGRKATLGHPVGHRRDRPAIVLAHGGGGGSDRRWSGRMWLWPLPPPGPLTLAFAWPALGIPERTIDLASQPIIAAAARAVELWPETRPEPPKRGDVGGWTAYGPA
jgi:hypothetical protein